MAEENGRTGKRSQKFQNTAGARNVSRDRIEDVCLEAYYTLKFQEMAWDLIYSFTDLCAVFTHSEFRRNSLE